MSLSFLIHYTRQKFHIPNKLTENHEQFPDLKFIIDKINFLIYNYFLKSFLHHHQPMVSPQSLSDSESPQVFRTLLSILDPSQYSRPFSVFWPISTMLHTTSYFQVLQSSYQSLGMVPSAPITINSIVTFMFH